MAGAWPAQPHTAQPAGRRRLPSITSQCHSTALFLLPTTTLECCTDKEVTARGLILETEYLGRGGHCQNNSQHPLLTAQGACAVGQLHCFGGSCCLLLSVIFPRLLMPFSPVVGLCVLPSRDREGKDGTGKMLVALRLGCSHPAYSLLSVHSWKGEKREVSC